MFVSEVALVTLRQMYAWTNDFIAHLLDLTTFKIKT